MLEKLKEIIKNVMPEVDISGVTGDTKLIEDLHFDSMGIMMLAMAIEDQFGLEFSDSIDFATVQDVVDYIEKNQK